MNKLPVYPVENSNGALRFQMIDFSPRNRRAQSVSVGVHVAVIALLVFALAGEGCCKTRDTKLGDG